MTTTMGADGTGGTEPSSTPWWRRMAPAARTATLVFAIFLAIGSMDHLNRRLSSFGVWFRLANLVSWVVVSVAATLLLLWLFGVIDRKFSAGGSAYAEAGSLLLSALALCVIAVFIAKGASSDYPPNSKVTTDGGLALFTDSAVSLADISMNVQSTARAVGVPLLDVDVTIETPLTSPVTVTLLGSGGLAPTEAWVVPFTNQEGVPVLGETLPARRVTNLLHTDPNPSGGPYNSFVFRSHGVSIYLAQHWFDPTTARSVSFRAVPGQEVMLLLRVADPTIEQSKKFRYVRGGIATVGCANGLARRLRPLLGASADRLGTDSLFVPDRCLVQNHFLTDPSGAILTTSRAPTNRESLEWDDQSATADTDPSSDGLKLTASPITFTVQLPGQKHRFFDRAAWLAFVLATAAAAGLAALAAGTRRRYEDSDEHRRTRVAEATAEAIYRLEQERQARSDPPHDEEPPPRSKHLWGWLRRTRR